MEALARALQMNPKLKVQARQDKDFASIQNDAAFRKLVE